MILLANNAEKDIAMLEKNYGGFDKIIEQLMSSIVIRELLKTLPEYLRLKWVLQQFAAWVNEQNDVISKVEIENEARPTEVKNDETNKNYNSREVSNNKKKCPICRFGDHKPKIS
jgi:hypothetical protein